MPQPKLPAYLAQMDVCLNVFRAGALSKDVSPLKFYEYLATGKPIVSTREPLQVEDFKDKERIARTIAEYIPDNSSIFLTLGTTVEVIAYALLERSGLMVITNTWWRRSP